MPFNQSHLHSIDVPVSSAQLTSRDILMGKKFDPVSQIKLYSEEEYEIFIAEWVSTISGKYAGIFKSKGGGDKGCDIIGFYDKVPSDKWDNYQCKHYDHPIAPAEFVAEVTKLIYYTYVKEYSVPKTYIFVAPQGLSNQTQELLRKPIDLKKRLLEDWNDNSPDSKLANTSPELNAYLNSFDLSTISFIDPQDVVNQHANCLWHARRFGGGLKPRPKPQSPPENVEQSELTYVNALQEAYGESKGQALSLDAIASDTTHSAHFSRQRRYFYSAESLRQFARETLPENGNFEELQQQIYDGVIEVVEAEHQTSLVRISQTLTTAKSVQLSEHILTPTITPEDRGGICHQLVNDRRLKWKKT